MLFNDRKEKGYRQPYRFTPWPTRKRVVINDENPKDSRRICVNMMDNTIHSKCWLVKFVNIDFNN